jgi:tRNA U54 and U55 pseudouridine synthase Pus10
MEGKTPTQKILKNVCNKCIFVFQNSQLINSQQDKSEAMKSQDSLNSISFDTPSENTENNLSNKTCTFCLGILNPINFQKIIDKIFAELGNHEYKDYKITTNFSPLFQLTNAYVKFS